ncbi:MAG: tetratricopeptide (TPR) repeat protein [Planctomycetota bacterium]
MTQRLKIYAQFNKYAKGKSLALLLEEKGILNPDYIDCRNKKYLFRQLSEYMIAMKNYPKAIFYLKMLQSLDCFNPGKYFVLNYKMANMSISLNKNDTALFILQNYVQACIRKNDSASLIGAYNQYGLISSALGNHKSAIKSYEKAIQVIDNIDDQKNLRPLLLGNIGHNNR